ncbi:MAG: NnrU family protein [Gammaproteobacteria bacterium]|nr:NnrU family protein [Gammaproteobacteria bacterium]MCP5196536.1 NnrU family protein [Gammaproteobacteria bacterium]
MSLLLLGLVLFFAVHSIAIVNAPWRDRQAAALGEGPWKGLYALMALIGLGLIVWGYGLARHEPVVLYWPPVWLRHIALLLLVPVFPLLLAAYLPGRIQSVTRHPMLAATKLWAFAHLLANGMLADVLLFGAFLIWAVADRVSMKRRTTSSVLSAPPSRLNDAIAVVGGLTLYGAFVFWLHAWLIGVSPIGR